MDKSTSTSMTASMRANQEARPSPPPPPPPPLLQLNPTTTSNEWVEIVEPKSKKRIYANLETGICAKQAPSGAQVRKSEDFSDLWWELYDRKTGKYYYYNSEQQKTSWLRPDEKQQSNGRSHPSNGKGTGVKNKSLLIIPVLKLQTFKKLSSPSSREEGDLEIEKCDATTQTIASNLVSTGTQTIRDTELEKEFGEKLHINSDSGRSKNVAIISDSSFTNSKPTPRQENITTAAEPTTTKTNGRPNRNEPSHHFTTHRHLSDLNRSDRAAYERNMNQQKMFAGNVVTNAKISSAKTKSSLGHGTLAGDGGVPASPHNRPLIEGFTNSNSEDKEAQNNNNNNNDNSNDDYIRYFGSSGKQTASFNREAGKTLSIHTPIRGLNNQTSTFGSGQTKASSSTASSSTRPPKPNSAANNTATDNSILQQHKMTTNNLSHYLVREARSMGIALISDDEMDEDEPDSEDEFAVDDDEDTDLRSDLNASQDFGDESSEGWKSFSSDHESPGGGRGSDATNSTSRLSSSRPSSNSNLTNQQQQQPQPGASPLLLATSDGVSSAFTFAPNQPILRPKLPVTSASAQSNQANHLIDDEKNPASCLSQQLDHRKLVENFKKSRQSSSFGLHESLGRAYKLDANHAVQRIMHVADTYFHSYDTNKQDQQSTDRQLRQLSTISTLPRPHKDTKDKVALTSNAVIDADYDVVEENCNYHSDIENHHNQASGSKITSTNLLPNHSNNTTTTISSQKSSIFGQSPQTPGSGGGGGGGHFDRNKSTRGSTFSVESFARENLSRHPKKGGLLFNRKVKWSRMITWTKNPIKQPMISSVSSDLNSDSIASFKLIQQYMGDRKVSMNKKYRQIMAQVGCGGSISDTSTSRGGGVSQESGGQDLSSKRSVGSVNRSSSITSTGSTRISHDKQHNNSNLPDATSGNVASSNPTLIHNNSRIPNIPDRLRDELAYELVSRGCVKSALRDEIYVQLARQLTENPHQDSVSWGLVLMSILLNYFSPSNKFSPFLLSFLETHSHPMARDVCMPRLEKRLRQNWLSYCRKPADGKEISIVRLSITKWPQYCGVFGESLERIMELQACSPYLKTLRLPWILTTLGEKLIATGGMETEGIFRCAADHDLIAQLRLEIDCVDFRKISDELQVRLLLCNVQDPHVIAGLLKLFFRQLSEPVFPSNIYDLCLQSGQQDEQACQRVFQEQLSNLNKDVVAYLIRLLQMLAQPDKVANTKMDNSNLSMVWAPNLLRSPDDSMRLPNGLGGYSQSTAGESKSGSKWSIAGSSTANQQDQPDGHHQPAPSQSMIFEQTRQEMQFVRSLLVHLDTSFIENVV